ncbi:MAG: DUF4097 family beta strand repeat protein [Bryobacteraceae bacterium]|nr:DUF4097 family beta strand repeat protein [Bryobacteraceae bacterium]
MRLTILALTATFPLLYGAEWSKNFQTSDAPVLDVRCGDANVDVRTGGTGIAARLITRGWEIRPGEVEVIERQTGDRVDIEVKLPRNENWNWNIGNRGIKLELQVPAKTRFHINTGDGNVKLSGLQADSRIETGDGNIEGDNVAGRMEARTGDGNVRIAGRFDLLAVQTGDGNVDLSATRGSTATAAWRIQTGDGNVSLEVPADMKMDLDATTGDGHVRSSLPLLIGAGKVGGSQLRGKLNGGGPTISIRTNDGNITLNESR